MTSQRARKVETVSLVAVLAFTLVPVVGTVVAATSVDFSRGPYGGGATLQWLGQAWTDLAPELWTSVKIAAVVLLLDVIVILPLVWWFGRSGSRVAAATQRVVNVPLAVPGIALGLALVSSYPVWRRDGYLLIAGHVLFTMPFVVAALLPVVADPAVVELERVAATLGSNAPTRLLTITLPSLAPAVVSALMMAFALSLGEFNVSFFVVPPSNQTAPFSLFDAYATQRLEVASAQTLLFVLMLLPATFALARVGDAAIRRSS